MKSALTTEIDGVTYEIGMFPADRGMDVLTRLITVAAPGLSSGEQDGDKIKLGVQALAVIGANLQVPEVKAVVMDMMSVVTIIGADGQASARETFPIHFAGRYGAIIKLCRAVSTHNGFFDFLAAFGSAAKV